MNIDAAWMESVVPAACIGLATLAAMVVALGWWRHRLNGTETQSIRARIVEAAPPMAADAAAAQPPLRVMVHGEAGRRPLSGSSFIGRGPGALPPA